MAVTEVRRKDAAPALSVIRSRGRIRGIVALLGPAFVAAVAYVDPGNFATNVSAGARFGYLLVWVVVVANLMAMLVQYLSAKLGIVTGSDLPELCRSHFHRRVVVGLWVQAELIAMATDLAEFVGAAVGMNLLFGIRLLPAGLITAVIAFGVLALQQRGYRRFEVAIIALLAVVLAGLVYDVVAVGFSGSQAVTGLLPRFDGADSVLLAVGIVGATVMPHAVYLHSALTKRRVLARGDGERRQLLHFARLDVSIALGLAGVINVVMVLIAAHLFHASGQWDVGTIEAAHDGLSRMVGGGAALAFAVALLASGLSSTSVGTYAGQVVMQGFINRHIPVFARRALTMVPALMVLALGLSPTASLVVSQVVLSFGIPFALVPLVLLGRRADVMGALRNRAVTTSAAWAVTGSIIALNAYLLYATFTAL